MVASLIARIPRGLRQRARRFLGDAAPAPAAPQLREITLDKVLLGDENGVSAAALARVTGNLLRASQSIEQFPHTQLLRQYQEIGDRLFEPAVLEQTPYFKNGAECVDLMGHYFEAWSENDVANVARRFIASFSGGDPAAYAPQEGQSGPGMPIHVRPIEFSDCYQVIDGHHRLALAHVRGLGHVSVCVEPAPVLTPLQSLLMDVQWTKGKFLVYQPVDAPELKHRWIQTRKCSDRFEKMHAFLRGNNLLPPRSQSFVDIGCGYGWFVREMTRLGFDAYGVELDPVATMVGQAVYGLQPRQFFRMDCVRFLERCAQTYDVACCCSLMHHFALGEESLSAETFIRLIDRIAGKVLFFDTGQCTESWFRQTLPLWNPEFVQAWLKKNTTFNEVIPLGPDEDGVAPFGENYGRMLFACVR